MRKYAHWREVWRMGGGTHNLVELRTPDGYQPEIVGVHRYDVTTVLFQYWLGRNNGAPEGLWGNLWRIRMQRNPYLLTVLRKKRVLIDAIVAATPKRGPREVTQEATTVRERRRA